MNDADNRAPAINHVLTGEAFDALIGGFQHEPLLAADTEAASFHRYRDRIYLIQLSSRSETAVVDPLAVHELGGLGTLLSNPKIEIIFHDADYDLQRTQRLEADGWTVLRFWNDDVLRDIDNICEHILRVIGKGAFE